MKVNSRKPLKLLSNANYFIPGKDKVRNTFSSPLAYQSRKARIEAFETRLYWEYKRSDSLGCPTFFMTLTYNDKAMPTFEGKNCHDYEDLRWLLNGAFHKYLLRNYGLNFKSFTGCELGDGKGERGMHNNPHFHVLFFTYPDETYHKTVELSDKDFLHIVKMYWQGFDESEGYHDYREAKYGIVRPGKYGVRVNSFRACTYAAKYVVKDAAQRNREEGIERNLRYRFARKYRYPDTELLSEFFRTVINPKYNIPTRPHLDDVLHDDWHYTPEQLVEVIAPQTYESFKSKRECAPSLSIMFFVRDIVDEIGLKPEYDQFISQKVESEVSEKLNEYRNRFSPKPRISQGVGDYALDFIVDKMHPTIQVPKKNGYKERPISMYYYRKLYCDVVKDAMGQPVYVLNELGQRYKLAQMQSRKDKMRWHTAANLRMLTNKLYDDMLLSDVNTDVRMTYQQFCDRLDKVNINTLINRYAEFKCIYEDRFLKVSKVGDTDEFRFPDIDCVGDYKRFIKPSYYEGVYNPFGVTDFVENTPEDYVSYDSHPYFLPYVGLFAVLDLLSDYLFCQGDEVAQQDAEEVAAVRRYHTQLDLKQFYSQFNVA